jgi:hypothetical protein
MDNLAVLAALGSSTLAAEGWILAVLAALGSSTLAAEESAGVECSLSKLLDHNWQRPHQICTCTLGCLQTQPSEPEETKSLKAVCSP